MIRAWLCLILSRANISTATLSWNRGEHSNVIVGKVLLSFSFEILMTNSDSLFDLMIAGLLPISWVRFFSIAHGLNILFLFRVHFTCEMCRVWLWVWSWRLIFSRQDLKSSSSSHSAVGLHFFNYPFLFFNFTVVTSCHVSFSTVYTLRLFWALICFVACVVFFSAVSANCFSSAWTGFDTCIQRYLMVVRGYREYTGVLASWGQGVLL